MLITASVILAGPVGTAAGFEDDDGNLIAQAPINFDWNSFNPTTWTGTAPYRQSDKVTSGWTFKGIEDAAAVTSDTAFAGGVKQDDNCASVNTGKAPNKDDLKRIYLATKVVSGHTYLELAWVRIPQNTTSPSAHVAFEFNKGKVACPAGSDGLVNRVAGDMLIVYDFEGGTTDVPTLTLRRWVTTGSCEVGSDSAPCWGIATNLTAGGFAEAKVNTTATALDTIAPASATLGLSEFGEAGIDLTGAGVFTAGTCETYGKAFGVSRSSGNSGTAQMKDLVGPANFQLANCGEVNIIKRTNPRGLDQGFDFTSTIPAASTCSTDPTPAAFTLNDKDNVSTDSTANTEHCVDVPVGTYTVTEGSDPAGFQFNNFACTSSGTGTSTSPVTSTTQKNVSITVGAGGTVTCVYTNDQQLGAIKITKTSAKSGNALAGAKFSITSGGNAITGSPFTTDANGNVCVDGLGFGDYVVTETDAPTGFVIDDGAGRTITVDNNAKCSDATYVGETTSFTDTPVADIQVRFRDGGSGETALEEAMTCTNATGTSSTADTTGWDDTLTVSGVKVGSTTVTITCTIKIDP
jgi:hypothetical protein